MKNKKKKQFKKHIKNLQFNVLVLLVLLILSIFSLHILRISLLENAQTTGDILAKSYAEEEQNSIAVYETLISIGTQYMEINLKNDTSKENLISWITSYYNNMSEIIGENAIDPYAVVNGSLIAANTWDGDDEYDYKSSQWYRKAIEADGKVIFTDAYIDAITEKPIITIAKKCQNSDNVLAFDIFPDNIKLTMEYRELPEGIGYFLCDQQGTILYYTTPVTATDEQIQNYIKDLLVKIQEGTLNSFDSYIYDLDKKQRGVYYSIMDNGWITIITLPYYTILGSLRNLGVIFLIIFIVFIFADIIMLMRDYKMNKNIMRTNETIKVLANSCHSLYRVDLVHNTYEMIKGSDYVRERLKKKGNYNDLLDVFAGIIEKNAYKEFVDSFSIENIERLIKNKVGDFGGDFRRLFDGEYKWTSVRVLFDESLSTDEVVLYFKNIDEEKQNQLKHNRLLEEALETTRKSEQTKNMFFSNMSHDMRTPLNAIIGLSELALKYKDNPERVSDYINKIILSSKHLLGLINDILEMSRLEQGKVTIDNKSFDLRKCIKECAEVFRHHAELDNKTLTLEFDMRDSLVVGDPFRISQILNNILSNAFKFTSPGGHILIKVKQLIYQEYEKYQITISDDGIGMSEAFLQQIFDPYVRETMFTDKRISGTGLGMTIVKNLVSQMNGQITVDSKLGEGTTFTITLPLQVVSSKEKSIELQSSDNDNNKALDECRGMNILLAEDNEINMEIATDILFINGLNVTQAWNGAEAVDKFIASPEFSYDAILMDMQMPKMDGCEAAKKIRALPRSDAKTVPIIAVTANAFAEDIAATIESGMNAHISKPIDFSILYKTLSKLRNNKS